MAVTDVAAYTGSPEILDGRVKTLHPKIHGGLLGRRRFPTMWRRCSNMASATSTSSSSICIPLKRPSRSPIVRSRRRLKISISAGPSMLRSAAKNHEDVLVLVDPADYGRVLEALKAGTVTPALRRELGHEGVSTYRSL